jgi:hypothetical protein
MRFNPRTIIIFLLLLPIILFACSGGSDEGPDPTLTAVQNNIIGSWVSTDITASSEETWQFLPDGTFIDTQGGSFQYKIHEIDGFNYIALNADDLKIEPSEELTEALEDSLGSTDFIPIYQVTMPSNSSIIIEPAANLYGSDSYFGFTFQTYVLRRR